jgi:hypothetical protein
MVESQYCQKFVLRQMYRKTLFRQNVPKFEISAEEIRLKKNNFFTIGPVVFPPRTQTYMTELKKMDYS